MIQTGKDKPIVFVSHVEEDAAVASKIKNWLEDNLLEGVEVFVSSDEGIKPGDKWEERIIEKLKNCSIALIVCTQMSVRQPWVNFEAGGALVKGARVIPLCYHGQRKETLLRPLSSLEALDLSEPKDVNKLLKIIAEEAGLRAPEIDPKGLMERLPQRNYEELEADGKLSDIKVKVEYVALVGNPYGENFIWLKVENHDKNSVFLTIPKITLKNSRDYFPIFQDFAFHRPVPTGELRSGDSWDVYVDPNKFGIENIDRLENVIFPDKIGREFKGSAEDTLNAIKAWKSAEASGTHEGLEESTHLG